MEKIREIVKELEEEKQSIINQREDLDGKIKAIEEAILKLDKIGCKEFSKKKLGRPKGTTKYTEEQLDFLKESVESNKNMHGITPAFNKKFGTKIKEGSRQLYNLIKRNFPSNEKCPYCLSKEIIKHGIRHCKKGDIQRFECKSCNKKFSNLGIEHRMRHSEEFIEKAVEEYSSGKSSERVGKEVGVCRQTVTKWKKALKKRAIPENSEEAKERGKKEVDSMIQEFGGVNIVDRIKGLPEKEKSNNLGEFVLRNRNLENLQLRELIGDKFKIWLSEEQIELIKSGKSRKKFEIKEKQGLTEEEIDNYFKVEE